MRFTGRSIPAAVTVLILLILIGVVGAKESTMLNGAFGSTLFVGEVKDLGMGVHLMKDGRSAPTGPYLSKKDAQALASALKQGWVHRHKKDWKSETFRDHDSYVYVWILDEHVCLMTGDKKHTSKSFAFQDQKQLLQVVKLLGGAHPSKGNPAHSYPKAKK